MRNKKFSIILSLVLCLFASFMGVFLSACSCENNGSGKITEIYIKEGSVQTEVYHNSTFSTDGIEIFAKLSNGKEREIDISDCEISSIDTTTVGEKELTVTYEAYEVKITINVVATLSKISLTGVEDSVLHNSNGGELDLSNAQIVLTFSDGTTQNVDVLTDGSLTTGVVVENNSTATVGNKQLKVKYLEKECTFNYTVEKYLTKIEAKLDDEYKSVAYKGEFMASKITAIGTYSDMSTEKFENSKLTISSLDTTNKNNIKDDNIVVVKLKEDETFQDEIKVKIYAKLTSIEFVSGLENRIKYNTDLDLTNLKIKAIFNDDSEKEVTGQAVVDGYNKQILGSQTLTIKYKDETVSEYVSTTFGVTVYEELESLRVEVVNATDATTGYVLKDSNWEEEKENVCAKFKIVAVYTKNEVVLTGTSEYSSVEFSSIDTTTVGDKDLIVSYNGKQTTIKIHVIRDWSDASDSIEVSSISIVDSSVASEVDYNGTLDVSNLKIQVTYSNNLTQILKASEYTSDDDKIEITNIDTSVHGEQNLVVSYKTQNASKKIVVKKYLSLIYIKEGTAVSNIIFGDEIDLSKVEIYAQFTDNSEEKIDISLISVDKTNFNNSELGKQTIKFTYTMEKVDGTKVSKDVLMEVEVCDEVESFVSVTATVTRSEVGEEYDYSNIVVRVKYFSGKEENLPTERLSFSGLNVNKVGTQELKISYNNGKTELYDKIEIEIYNTLVSIEIEAGSVGESVNMGGELDTSNIVLILNYKDGSAQKATSGYTVESFSTEFEGEYPLTVSYETKQATKTISVVRTYKIIGYNNPKFVDIYNENKQNKNTFTATGSTGNIGFTDLNNTYVVGNENEFVFDPIIKDDDTNEITKFKANIKVSLFNEETSEYEELTENLSTYVAIDDTQHTFKFTQESENKKFKIEVLPYTIKSGEEVNASTLEFKVIKAYNVYNAHDLSMFDNVNALNKWSEKKTSEELELSNNIHGLVLHSNISIQDSDLPSVQFFTEDNPYVKDYFSSSDADYSRVSGSLIDSYKSDLGLIYQRQTANGETFTIEGNYFKLSAQDIKLIVRAMDSGVWPVVTEGDAITVHTALFGFCSKSGAKSSYEVNNIALFGNCKKSEDSLLSGGIIFMKALSSTSFTAYNNISQGWYINYFFEGNSILSDNCVNKLDKVNCFDAYNTMLYVWGSKDVRIENSYLIGAGGPAMICDHVKNDKTTGEGGYISNVKVTNSTIESYVAGTEGWFATYEGSGAFVSSFKAMNALITPYGNTLCDSKGEKINLISVFKSCDAEGLTYSKIRGTFADTNEKYTNGLDLSSQAIETTKNQIIASLAGSGMTQEQIEQTVAQMAVLQTFNGEVAVPGSEGWLVAPDATNFAQSEGYLNVYLFNGMGVVLGLNKSA